MNKGPGGSRMQNLLVKNIYRNINKNGESKSASADDIEKWIKAQRVAGKSDTYKTRDCVIVGDFKPHDFKLDGRDNRPANLLST
jgi:hypothetical protein